MTTLTLLVLLLLCLATGPASPIAGVQGYWLRENLATVAIHGALTGGALALFILAVLRSLS